MKMNLKTPEIGKYALIKILSLNSFIQVAAPRHVDGGVKCLLLSWITGYITEEVWIPVQNIELMYFYDSTEELTAAVKRHVKKDK